MRSTYRSNRKVWHIVYYSYGFLFLWEDLLVGWSYVVVVLLAYWAASASVINLRHVFMRMVLVCVCERECERPGDPKRSWCQQAGKTDALQESERPCVHSGVSLWWVCVTLGSCLNPLSLSNNEKGGGGVNIHLLHPPHPTQKKEKRSVKPCWLLSSLFLLLWQTSQHSLPRGLFYKPRRGAQWHTCAVKHQ